MERPILFSAEMVRAILEGRKSQTRRVMKPAKRNREGYKQGNGLWIDGYGTEERPNGHIKDYSISSVWQRKDYYIKDFAPYKPGDMLWVRETWADLRGMGFDKPFAYLADSINRYGKEDGDSKRCRLDYGVKWKPSIHMPKDAARLFLRVTSVRLERLHDIDELDATHEGVTKNLGIHARDDFARLWDSINAKRGYGWDTNPWVWVVEFEVIPNGN